MIHEQSVQQAASVFASLAAATFFGDSFLLSTLRARVMLRPVLEELKQSNQVFAACYGLIALWQMATVLSDPMHQGVSFLASLLILMIVEPYLSTVMALMIMIMTNALISAWCDVAVAHFIRQDHYQQDSITLSTHSLFFKAALRVLPLYARSFMIFYATAHAEDPVINRLAQVFLTHPIAHIPAEWSLVLFQ